MRRSPWTDGTGPGAPVRRGTMGMATLLFLALCAVAAPAAAQLPGELRGRVTERGTGTPVSGARVELTGDAATTTRPDGSFRLRGVAAGSREVRVSALGFREHRAAVEVADGRAAWLAVALEPQAVALAGITVSARRAPEGARTLDRAAIEASGAREMGELLQTLPGVVVTRRGGPGSPVSVSVRGSSADQVLLLVDGVPANDALTGEADLSSLPLEAVESVTVLRGAQSARYGGRALAGVVAVQTRRPGASELAARAVAGSWGERLAAGSAGGRAVRGAAALSGLVSGEWREVRGDFDVLLPPERGGGADRRRNGDASLRTLLATGTSEWGTTELRLRGEVAANDRGMPGPVAAPSPGARQEQQRLAGGAALGGTAGGVEWRALADVQAQDARYGDPAPPLGGAYHETVDARAVGGEVAVGGDLGSVALTLGGDARRLRVRSTMLADDAPRAQTLTGAWAEAHWTRGIGTRWTADATAALRADHDSRRGGTEWSPRVGLSAATGHLALRLSAGNAFSPPSLTDQFFQTGLQARPNPDLAPERVRGEVEAAVALRDLAAGALRVDGELAAYRADVRGMILWFPDHRFVWSPHNFDVRRAGWDASARVRHPGRGAELRGTVTHTAVEYTGPVLGGQVIYRPRWTASGAATATLAGVRTALEARWVGERRTVAGSAINTLAAHWLADLRLARPFTVAAWSGEASVAVENLLDRDAAMLVDYPYPGRAWSLGFRVRREPRRAQVPGDLHP